MVSKLHRVYQHTFLATSFILLNLSCSLILPATSSVSTPDTLMLIETETPNLPSLAAGSPSVGATQTLPVVAVATLPIPSGGWRVFRNSEHGFSFEYPSVYDNGECGEIVVTDDEAGTSITVEDGTIDIVISQSSKQQLDQYVGSVEQSMELLEPPKNITVGGVPAVALVFALSGPSQYRRETLVFHEGKLFIFGYAFINFLFCDAPPVSAEAVYEHILHTWRFEN